jgi:hypothetical protein
VDRRGYWMGILASGGVANVVAAAVLVATSDSGSEVVALLGLTNVVAGMVAWRSRTGGASNRTP